MGTTYTLLLSTDPDFRLDQARLLQLQAMRPLIPGRLGMSVRNTEEDVELYASDHEPRFWGGGGSGVSCPQCTEDRTRQAFSLLSDFHDGGYVVEPSHVCSCGSATRLTHMQFDFCALAYFGINMCDAMRSVTLPVELQRRLNTRYAFTSEPDDHHPFLIELADFLGTQLQIVSFKL